MNRSFKEKITSLLLTIVSSPDLHAKWLNTLSYLENSGAKKIAACQHPTLVKEEVLKHASEEFRHAHYLKKQIQRVTQYPLPDYRPDFILGGFSTLHYLHALDLYTSRYLKTNNLPKSHAYLFVTYAIELRADELYPIYDDILRKNHSKVTVRSILLEEKEHLQEMREGIDAIPEGFSHAQEICTIEQLLCKRWLNSILFELTKKIVLSYH